MTSNPHADPPTGRASDKVDLDVLLRDVKPYSGGNEFAIPGFFETRSGARRVRRFVPRRAREGTRLSAVAAIVLDTARTRGGGEVGTVGTPETVPGSPLRDVDPGER